MIKRQHPDGLAGPHPFAIAHHLLGRWLHGGIRRRRIAGTSSWPDRLTPDLVPADCGTGMTDPGMNFHDCRAENPAAHSLHRHAGARPDVSRPGRSRRAAPRRTPPISTKSAAATRSMPRSASCGSAAAPRSAGRWATPAKPSSRYIFDKLAHEGIDTKHIVHMPGLVTPISNIMIDPSGERTIVTFRDPELWKVRLPDTDTLLEDCAAILTESRCAEFCTDLCAEARRRGIPVDRRRRPRDVAARRAADRVLASGVLQRAAAGDRRRRRRRRGAEEDRQADAVVPGGHARRRRARSGSTSSGDLQQTPAFPVHTVDTLGAGDVFHGAFALAITEKQELRQALRFASAAAALKCTRFGGAFAAPQRAEVEELLSQGQSRRPGPRRPIMGLS